MVEGYECKYHIILTRLTEEINQKLDERYNWEFFDLWLWEDSNFAGVYRGAFEILNERFNTHFTEEQLQTVENKGRNLQNTMSNWLSKWKTNHPTLLNEKMPLSCLKHKVYEYIFSQLKTADMRALLGTPC